MACPVCGRTYTETVRREISLSCGHTKCLLCFHDDASCGQCQPSENLNETADMSLDLGCRMLPSTPQLSPFKPGKHGLTPTSRILPPSKRQHQTLDDSIDDQQLFVTNTEPITSTPLPKPHTIHSGAATQARTNLIEGYFVKSFTDDDEGVVHVPDIIEELKNLDMSGNEKRYMEDLTSLSVIRVARRVFPDSSYNKKQKSLKGISRIMHDTTKIEMTNDDIVATLLKQVEDLKKLKTPCDELSTGQSNHLWREIQSLKNIYNIGIRGNKKLPSKNASIPVDLFIDIQEKVKASCPLIHDMLSHLVIDEDKISDNIIKTEDVKMRSAIHCLSQLADIRSQNILNDIPVVFGFAAISYGAGERFINMLAKLGLSEHWSTLVRHLQHRLSNYSETISDFIGDYKGPLLLGLDNINLYKGNKSHSRFFKKVTPNMWNFTVRCAIKPDMSSINHLLDELEQDPQAASKPQKPLHEVTVDDVILNSPANTIHADIVNRAKKDYIIKAMDLAYNVIPKDMPVENVKDFKDWLKVHKSDLEKKKRTKEEPMPLQTSKPKPKPNNQKSETLILPLSTENSSSKTGMANIVHEFASDLGITLKEASSYLHLNKDMKYDLNEARQRYLFQCEMVEHQSQQASMLQSISATEKQFDDEAVDSDEDIDCDDGNIERGQKHSHLSNLRGTWKKQDLEFASNFEELQKQIKVGVEAQDIPGVIHFLRQNLSKWELVDRYGRTFLHRAVELQNLHLIKVLLSIGININAKEGCGATALTLAVTSEQSDVVRILVEKGASIQPEYYVGLPAPLELAESLGLNDITDILQPDLNMDKELYKNLRDMTLDSKELANHASDSVATVPSETGTTRPCLFFGDVGSTRILRAVADTKSDTYGWVTSTPGDLHAGGYMEECVAKAQGPGGLYHAANTVLGRRKVVPDIYGNAKLKEGNLRLGREANRDVAMGYTLAAVLSFRNSTFYPSKAQIEASRRNRKLEDMLYEKFLEWCDATQEKDKSVAYHLEMVLLFGPVMNLFYKSVKNGDGIAREACWLAFLPVFLQMRKKNYFVDALIYAINFKAHWPLVLRCMLQHNTSISLLGHKGKNIALDEYIESEIVRPLKRYSTTKTTLPVLKLICANLQLVTEARQAYVSAYNVRHTSKHKEQDPLPDQVVVARWCLEQKFFLDEGRPLPSTFKYDGCPNRDFVQECCMDVHHKGEAKLRNGDFFAEKMYKYFPEYRRLPKE